MRKRVFQTNILTAIFVTVICGVLFLTVFFSFFTNHISEDLELYAQHIAAALNSSAEDDGIFLRSLHTSGIRITLIDGDGKVLYDNYADPSRMDNHLTRPEVADAIRNSSGESTRKSDTLTLRTHYYALLLDNGHVLRLAASQDSVFSLMLKMTAPVAAVAGLAIVISYYLARAAAVRITQPINDLDLSDPLSNDVYEELSPLLIGINDLIIALSGKTEELTKHLTDFSALADNMQEGLIFLDLNKRVLSINKGACDLFRVGAKEVVGGNLLGVSRNLLLQEVADSALAGSSKEALLEADGRTYSLFASPTIGDGAAVGCIILILDVTEKQDAEKIRREFSANVSHELKTPLQSISGYAEIIENGIAKNADIKRFSAKIHAEALRLTALIDDIMRISQLDEGAKNAPVEQVNLLALAEETASIFKESAKTNKVRVTTEGAEASISGVRTILSEMLANLIDNAIKYNVTGGLVAVSVETKDGCVVLSVTDTGIGIPKEHLARVFERFYRADKSRSRDAGGTGLGLSIVKHGAQFHNAKVEIESAVGKGTAIKVVFPSP